MLFFRHWKKRNDPSNANNVFNIEELIKKEIKTWLDIVENNYHIKPIIYTNIDFYKQNLDDDFDDYPLWVAHYYQPRQPRQIDRRAGIRSSSACSRRRARQARLPPHSRPGAWHRESASGAIEVLAWLPAVAPRSCQAQSPFRSG